MASIVGICNSALIKLGQVTIISLTQGDKNANLCDEQFEKMRDELLRSHPWNFAVARVQLAQLSATPAFEFDFAYQMPAGWLRTISVHDNNRGAGQARYRMQARTLLSNATTIYLRYVQIITDPNTMDAQFREALAWKLAADLALPITQSMTTVENMQKGFVAAVSAAKGSDAVEDYPEEEPESDWSLARN